MTTKIKTKKIYSFAIKDKVSCTSDNTAYKAIIIDHKMDHAENPIYQIHYHGWADTWDEWISFNERFRLKKVSSVEEWDKINLNQKNAKRSKKSFRENSSSIDITVKPITNSNEISLPMDDERDICNQKKWAKDQIMVSLSFKLKDYNMAQYLMINDRNFPQLINIPKKNKALTINGFLETFLNKESIAKESIAEDWISVIEGLRVYFNVYIHKTLLMSDSEYKQKNNMMKNIIQNKNGNNDNKIITFENMNEIDFCDYYGCEHLIRLLYQFSSIMESTNVTIKQAMIVSQKISMLVRYLDSHLEEYCEPIQWYEKVLGNSRTFPSNNTNNN